MGKETKKAILLIAIILVVPVVCLIASIAGQGGEKEKKEAQEQAALENYELIKEKLYNPENQKYSKSAVKKEDTPANLEELPYIVLRSYVPGDTGSVWELSTSMSDLGENQAKLKTKLTEEDLKDIPVIVIAISEVRGKTYKYLTGGSGKVEITTEAVDIYFYNTKTETIFMTDRMEATPLPESTNSSHSYKKSTYDVSNQIKTNLGRFVFPTWLGVILGLAAVITPFVLIGAIKGIKEGKKQKQN